MKKVYLVGPESNTAVGRQELRKAQDALTGAGYTVLVPALDLTPARSDEELRQDADDDLALLESADLLVTLPETPDGLGEIILAPSLGVRVVSLTAALSLSAT